MIQFGEEITRNLEQALRREWIETNGIGGFSSSTIIGLNTRRYHGLLTAATKPPLGRYVLLSKLEETIFVDDRAFELSANRYPGVVHPQGFRYLKLFRLDPFPVFTYEVEGVEIEKTVLMIQGENSALVEYEVKNCPKNLRILRLELRPLIAFRDYHATTHENGAINPVVTQQEGQASVTPYPGLPTLYLSHNALDLRRTGNWYRNFEYDIERERGLDFAEDLFNPMILEFDLKATASIIASTEPHDIADLAKYRVAEIERRRKLKGSIENNFVQTLNVDADQFIVTRGDQKTVIAGFHWFSDWGRDTMITLPGLTLVTGRCEVARSLLLTFARNVDQGMLPNRFPDAGETPEYNTVDATLWFFEAARAYFAYTGDLEFLRNELYPVLADIVSWHVRGTRFGIRVDSDGLLRSGAPGLQLTWMDARCNDWVVTPRRGKPVEIQALWYNALCIMEEFAHFFGNDPARDHYRTLAVEARSSFNRLFWNEGPGCLFDVVDGEFRDPSIRPNQIFAVSLPHSMLSAERAKSVVNSAQSFLLTPYGLRSLAPSDPQYHGRYIGGPAERDAAYHQGTVWPWLIGPFLTAYIKVNGGSDEARRQAAQWLEPLQKYANDAGLGQIPELFDGDPPHLPRGCIAQAWSVAEVLRLYADLSPITSAELASARTR